MKPAASLVTRTLLVVAFAAAGCQSVHSSDIRTSGIRANITVGSASPENAEVEVLLQVGGERSNTYVSLSGDDRLVVYYAGNTYAMGSDIAIPGQARYTAWVPLLSTEAELRVAFERGPDDTTAPNSTALMPPRLNLSPLATTPYSRARDALQESWSPVIPSDRVKYLVSGQCLVPIEVGPASDPGGFNLPAGSLHKAKPPTDPSQQGTTIPDNCTAGITVTKERQGKVDPAFSGGEFKVSQEVMTWFESVP